MKHISVLIIKRQGCVLCRLWVCFIALRGPVQRWIIIMLPSLLMDMRLAAALEASVPHCRMGNGEEGLELW